MQEKLELWMRVWFQMIPSPYLVTILTNHGIWLKYNYLTWNEIYFKVISWGYFLHFTMCFLTLSTDYSEAWFFVKVSPVVSVVRNRHCFSWWLWLKAIEELAVKFPLRIAINSWLKVLKIQFQLDLSHSCQYQAPLLTKFIHPFLVRGPTT